MQKTRPRKKNLLVLLYATIQPLQEVQTHREKMSQQK